MVKALRLMKIKEILKAYGVIDTQTLSNLSEVSKVTIRSDLIQLENEGFLIRTHGGAILRQPANEIAAAQQLMSAPVPKPTADALGKMQELGEVVRRHITPASWILLGHGSTCREVAKSIVNMDIKIVTANIDAAITLSKNQNIDIFVPGGYLHNRYGYVMLSGEWCQKALIGLQVDQAYLSVVGVDAAGFSVGDILECQTLGLFRKIAQEVIVVVDSTKFGKTAFYRIGDLNYADTIITDDGIPDNYREFIQQAKVKLITPSADLARG